MSKYLFLILAGVFLFPHSGKAVLLTRGQINADFNLSYNNENITIPASTVQSWSAPTNIEKPAVFSNQLSAKTLLAKYAGKNVSINNATRSNFNPTPVYNYLKGISSKINQPAVEPVLNIDGNKVTAFTEPQDGQELDFYNSTMEIISALENGQASTTLNISITHPQKTLSELNNLGIKTLLARGTSSFAGSPNNRRHNIAVGVEKFMGILLAPGEEFSFNEHLGPVTAEEGFVPELVINNGTTLPELGGGLCQVSSTTFRAAMAAGLPITARRNHAYAVQYYSPQGTDATIYPGSADLKFVNNTPGDILIWPYAPDKNTLYFDFWGTDDGRQVTLEKPIIYDRKPDGAMKATWTRLITQNGTTTTDTFKSNYQSPALFHKTETFVSATGSQSTIKTN